MAYKRTRSAGGGCPCGCDQTASARREGEMETGSATRTYAQRKAAYQRCLNAYRPTGRPSARSGKAFRRAFRRPRQAYLNCQHLNPDIPRFMRGWTRQEQRRQALAARQRRGQFTPAGAQTTAARQQRWLAIANDPAQSAAAQKWATDQLARLARGRKDLAKLQQGRTVRKRELRGTPGYDVGHPLGTVVVRGKRVPKKSLQDPRTFRPEMAVQNQGRPAIARRLNLDTRAFAESDPEDLLEVIDMDREYEHEYDLEEETELDQFLDSVWGWFSPSTPTRVAVISRSAWGARPPKCQSPLRTPVRYAFIHHTAGSTPTSQSQERATMQQTQRYHQNSRGWCDIAYNFLIMPSGRVYEGRGWRRVNGATKGYNSNSLAFCFAGNFETAVPTAASISACRALLAQGVADGYLTSGFTLRGHRDVGSTACPGRNLYARLPDLYP